MRIGVSGSELNRHLVGLDRLLHPPRLVQNVAQIEIGQGVTGIGLQGGAVVFFRQGEILPVVIKRAQIDVRGRVLGLKLEYFLVGSQRFSLRRRILFERNAAGKPGGSIVFAGTGV